MRGTQVSVKSSVSIETIANLPEYQNEYGAGSQLAYSNANGSWGTAFRNLDSIPAWPTLKHTVSAGSFGDWKIVLKKE